MSEIRLIECPACAELNPEDQSCMGLLGGAIWHRCRACGQVFQETEHLVKDVTADDFAPSYSSLEPYI